MMGIGTGFAVMAAAGLAVALASWFTAVPKEWRNWLRSHDRGAPEDHQ
jgi:hypothetical protein